MNALLGFVFLALGGLLLLMILVEICDALAAVIHRRRLRRQAGELRPTWLDDSTPTEPGFHLGGSGFHLEGDESLLRRRHHRRLELEPRGRFGFAIKWIRGE